MIGVYNHLLRKRFWFHYHSQKVIGSLGKESVIQTSKKSPTGLSWTDASTWVLSISKSHEQLTIGSVWDSVPVIFWWDFWWIFLHKQLFLPGQKQLTFDCTQGVKFGKICGVHPNSFTTIWEMLWKSPWKSKTSPKICWNIYYKIVDWWNSLFFLLMVVGFPGVNLVSQSLIGG